MLNGILEIKRHGFGVHFYFEKKYIKELINRFLLAFWCCFEYYFPYVSSIFQEFTFFSLSIIKISSKSIKKYPIRLKRISEFIPF